MINLDTHMLVFGMAGDVTPRERTILSANAWSISPIVLWEIAKLVELGRLKLDLDDPVVTRTLSALHVWPLDLAVSRQSTELDFEGDPADELIAATSIVHSVPLLTRDRVLRKSKMVPLAG